jgi:hypothetical protein
MKELQEYQGDAGTCHFTDTPEDGPVIKVVGTPEAIKAVRRGVKDLERRAHQTIQAAMTLQGDIIDTTCPVCFCEVPNDQQYILEPCSHMYCQDCAEGWVKTLEFPMKCYKQGCGEAMCLDDLKTLTHGSAQYDKAVSQAFSKFIGANARRWQPCMTPGCRQVSGEEKKISCKKKKLQEKKTARKIKLQEK